ncbi:MAG TPA: nuclear transport factor 2 family protein [Panacibacter sp.]|nr:nuclear transport factor 2 family protein [Panacibacter sp.]
MKRKLVFNCMLLPLLSCCTLFSVAQNSKPSPQVQKELDEAEAAMFKSVQDYNTAYFESIMSDDYITINADGVMMDKKQTIADTAHRKMMSGYACRLMEKTTRLYGNVGIITGKAQVMVQDKVMVEFLYTETWLKENNKWMFTGWQGTISKDSPPPPPMK